MRLGERRRASQGARVRWVAVVLPVILFVAGCATVRTPLPDADSAGARLYAARCGACHSVPSPRRLYYQQWVDLLAVMDTNMAHRGMRPLSGGERTVILAYLKAHAR